MAKYKFKTTEFEPKWQVDSDSFGGSLVDRLGLDQTYTKKEIIDALMESGGFGKGRIGSSIAWLRLQEGRALGFHGGLTYVVGPSGPQYFNHFSIYFKKVSPDKYQTYAISEDRDLE